MPSIVRLAALLGGLAFCASAMAADVDAQSYGYPLANPFEATIATTPPELRPELPADGDIRQSDYSVRLRPDREFELLDNFWPVTKLHYRLAVRPGTGVAGGRWRECLEVVVVQRIFQLFDAFRKGVRYHRASLAHRPVLTSLDLR